MQQCIPPPLILPPATHRAADPLQHHPLPLSATWYPDAAAVLRVPGVRRETPAPRAGPRQAGTRWELGAAKPPRSVSVEVAFSWFVLPGLVLLSWFLDRRDSGPGVVICSVFPWRSEGLEPCWLTSLSCLPLDFGRDILNTVALSCLA